jgi:hypothetical protein
MFKRDLKAKTRLTELKPERALLSEVPVAPVLQNGHLVR